MTKQNSFELSERIIRDPVLRKSIAKENHQWFFHVYFTDYIKYETALFQKELFAITEDETIKNAVICAFRGSAKSTILSMSYPIWSVVSKQQKKFILILSQTQSQVKLHMSNIKRELESNELLRADLGPFQQETEEWAADSIIIPRYNARIAACSAEQSIRGVRFGAHRPDLIIVDDAEDLNSVRTKEGRDKIFNWFTSEVIPCGDKNTKIILAGNLLHRDSLTMRLKKLIEENHFNGIFKEYPLIGTDNQIAWPGKFQTMKDVEDLRNLFASEAAFQREMNLKIISSQEQVICEEYLHYYNTEELPDERNILYYGVGIDLAISEKSTADYTAMVSGAVGCDLNGQVKVYILPNPINERITFPQTIEYIKRIRGSLGSMTNLFIEDFAYQSSVIQQLKEDGIYAQPTKIVGADKRTRLNLISNMVRNGQVVFPQTGCEDLINQLLGFGVEKHDDLVDAFVYLVNEAFKPENEPCTADDFVFV
jgi:predicted phage terminase large subunit-like protein